MSHPEELLDIGEAARFLKVSETSLRRWTNAGLLACFRVGGRQERRFRREDLLAFMQPHAAGSEANSRPPGAPGRAQTTVAGLVMPLGTHLCGLYSTDDGQRNQAATFLVDGLTMGGVSYLVAAPAARRAILLRLEESHPALDRELKARRLVVSTYAASPDRQWAYWEKHMEAALQAGAKTLRVVGDLVGLRARVSPAEVVEYEAGYEERIARRFPVVTLCQYDARHFTTLDLLDALKGHPDTFRYPADRVLA